MAERKVSGTEWFVIKTAAEDLVSEIQVQTQKLDALLIEERAVLNRAIRLRCVSGVESYVKWLRKSIDGIDECQLAPSGGSASALDAQQEKHEDT